MNIDELQIEITADSDSATKSIDNLIKSVGRLENINIRGFKNLDTSIKGLTEIKDFSNIRELSNSLKSLSGIKNNGFSNIANGLSKIPNAFRNLNGVNLSKPTKQIELLSKSLIPLTQLGKNQLTGFLNQLNKLPQTSENLKKVDFKSFEKNIKSLANAIKPLEGIHIKLGKAFSNLPNHINKSNSLFGRFANSQKEASNSSKGLISRLLSMTNVFEKVIGLNGFISHLGGVIWKPFTDYVENLNLFNVAMGESSKKAFEFANKVSKMTGIDTGDWLKYQGSLNMLARGFGVTNENAEIMSRNLTQLSYDYSSLMNVPVQEAFEKINSAMSGQIKGLKEYGNNVSTAMVKQTGLRYGLTGSVKDWNQSTQATMRYITIMENAGKVNVFNDMARTIKTPANAMRILGQQALSLKRALGSIASVIIGALVPYIQIGIQWLTALAQTVANLLGFEMPKIDYSGLSKGLSGVNGALDDTEDGLGKVGNKADKTKKKIKELKLQIADFDTFHIIKAPDEDKDKGSGSKGSGGIGGADLSKIQLPQYDFLKGLENQANNSVQKINKMFLDFFKPLTNSWDKYGKYVTESFKFEINSIKDLAKTIGKTWHEVWQNGTGEKTFDYIFKILGNINLTVSDFARGLEKAWKKADNGREIIQNLWDALNDLLKLGEDLSQSFRDVVKEISYDDIVSKIKDISKNFKDLVKVGTEAFKGIVDFGIKPFLKYLTSSGIKSGLDILNSGLELLKDTIKLLTPSIKTVGGVVKDVLIGTFEVASGVIKGLVDVSKFLLNVFGLFPRTTNVLTSSFVVMFGALKVTKMLSLFDYTNKVISAFSILGGLISRNLKFSELFDGIRNTNSALGNTFEIIHRLNKTDGVFKGLSSALGNLASKTTLASGETTILSNVLTWLSANPLVAVVGGVTALIGAYALLSGAFNDVNSGIINSEKYFSELREDIEKTIGKHKELNDEFRNEIGDINSKHFETLEIYKDLQKFGENKIKNIEEAKEKVKKLNDALGDEVVEIKNGKLEWKKQGDEILKSIDLMKKKAMLQANEKAYIEALKEQNEVTINLKKAQESYNQAQKEFNDLIASNTTDESQLDFYAKKVANAKDNLDKANKSFAENSQIIERQDQLYKNLDNTQKQSQKTIQDLANEYLNLNGKNALIVDDNGKLIYSYESMGDGIIAFTDIAQGNGEKYKNISNEQKAKASELANHMISELARQGYEQGSSLDQLKEKMGTSYASMTDTQKKALSDQLNAYKTQKEDLKKALEKHNIDINSEQGKQYFKELSEAQKNGYKQGDEKLKNLIQGIEKQKPNVETKGKDIASAYKKGVESKKPKFDVDVSPISKALDWIKNIALAPIKIAFGLNGAGGVAHMPSFKIPKFATGGFPDKGQMFIARERGAEMVGRIGNKTAVVNNQQIVDGITYGVARGVANAFSNINNTNGGNITVKVITQLDKKVLAEEVVEAHNEIVKQSGKSPLLV